MSKSQDPLRKVFLAVSLMVGGVIAAGVAAEFPYRDPQGAQETLEKTTNLKNIQIKDEHAWLGGCSSDGDFFKTKFKATNDKGQEVDGIVCKGLFFKGSTIRYQ